MKGLVAHDGQPTARLGLMNGKEDRAGSTWCVWAGCTTRQSTVAAVMVTVVTVAMGRGSDQGVRTDPPTSPEKGGSKGQRELLLLLLCRVPLSRAPLASRDPRAPCSLQCTPPHAGIAISSA